MRGLVLALALLVATSATARADDVTNAYQLGETAKQSGVAVDYSISGWNRYVDFNISSVLPGDARSVADAICQLAETKQTWKDAWTVRVFLVVGTRPAAECSTK